MKLFEVYKKHIRPYLGVALVVCLFIVVCYAPLLIGFVYDRINIGMTASEVQRILVTYKGHHAYVIKTCSSLDSDNHLIKSRWLSEWKNDCKDKLYDSQEFFNRLKAPLIETNGREVTDAYISVRFIGPGFLKNDFNIYFGIDGKVERVSDVKHWD